MDALLTKMMGQKPDYGEDFWVFAIVREDPALPTYEERVATFGTYEQCAQHLRGNGQWNGRCGFAIRRHPH